MTKLINAFQQMYTVKNIFLKFKKDVNSSSLKNKEIEKLAVLIGGNEEVSVGTIRKFLGISTSDNKTGFQDNVLNEIARYLGYSSWVKYIFDEKIKISKLNKLTIPNTRFQDLSIDWQQKIINAINERFLEKNYPTIDNYQAPPEPLEKGINPLFSIENDKGLLKFLKTRWYLYFFYEESTDSQNVPKYGRAVITIGERFDDVKLENFHDEENTDYTGQIHVDSHKTVLIFDFRTITGAKCLHILADVNTNGPTEILLGAYTNIGVGAQTIISGSIILENKSELDEELEPLMIGVQDEAFEDIDISIRKYLSEKTFNYHKTKEKTFSKNTLKSLVNSYKKKSIQQIPIHKHPRVIIATPKYSVDESLFKAKENAISRLVEHLTNDLKFKVANNILTDYDPLRFHAEELFEYDKRIKESDIFIMLYYTKSGSSSLMELAWALNHGKDIHIFTKEHLLPTIVGTNNHQMKTYFRFDNESDAVDYIAKQSKRIFQKTIKAFTPEKLLK